VVAKIIKIMSEPSEGFDVLRGWIAEIPLPAVLGVFRCDCPHEFVPPGFCQHGCGGDGSIDCIPVDHRPVAVETIFIEGAELVAVDKEEVRLWIETEDRPLYPGDGGPQDVQFVDFPRADRFYGPGNRFLFENGPQGVAVFFAHLFGIVEEGMLEVFRQDDGRGEYGSGKRTTPGLVASGFEPVGQTIRKQVNLARHHSRVDAAKLIIFEVF